MSKVKMYNNLVLILTSEHLPYRKMNLCICYIIKYRNAFIAVLCLISEDWKHVHHKSMVKLLWYKHMIERYTAIQKIGDYIVAFYNDKLSYSDQPSTESNLKCWIKH